jgi:hypothetical protein
MFRRGIERIEQCHSSSISGPSASANPIRRKISIERCHICVSGCSAPISREVPGNETSILPSASDSFWERKFAARDSSAAVTALRTSLSNFPNDRLFIFAERFHPLAPSGDAAAFAEKLYARGLERLFVRRRTDLAQRVVAQLFER